MAAYFSLLANVTVPILMTCIFGYLYQKYKNPDTRGFADLSLFVLAPCMIVSSLVSSSSIGESFLRTLLFVLLHSGLCWAASALAGSLFRLPTASRRAVELTTIFGNAVNYGLPLLLLAFGPEGFALGVSYVVCQVVLVNTFGLYLASRSSFKPREALRQVSRIPLIYAAAAGILLLLLRIPVPESLQSGLELLGGAYPAIVLLILGMQLRKTKWRSSGRLELKVAVALRLFVVPLIAWLCVELLGLTGLQAAVLFVQSSMPAAINTLVLVEKYEGDTELVAMTVGFTTVASFLYLPLLIQWSGAF